MKRLLFLLLGFLSGITVSVAVVSADELPTVSTPSAFSTSNDGSQVFTDDNSPQAIRAAKRHLYLPTKTPTPTEGVRWPTRNVKIYMDTNDHALQVAFRGAVRAWNKTGAVHLKWVKNEDQADIIARDGSLSNNDSTPVGYSTAQLGSTSTQYNPDTHSLIQARSTLDATHLDYTSRQFRTEVAEHELGHALGLAHAPEYMHSVMIPRNVKTGIAKLDRQTIRQLYNVTE